MSMIEELKFVVSSVAEDIDKGFKAADDAAGKLGETYEETDEISKRLQGSFGDMKNRLDLVKKATAAVGVETGKLPKGLTQVTTGFRQAASGAGMFAIAVMGLQLGIGIISKIKEAAEKSKQELAELNAEAAKMASDVGSATVLVDRYEELSKKIYKTKAETAEMENISQQMVTTYGMRADAVDDEGKLILTSLEYMKEQLGIQERLSRLTLEKAESENAGGLSTAIKKMVEAEDGLERVEKRIAEIKEQLAEPYDPSDRLAAQGQAHAMETLATLERTYETYLNNIRDGNDAVMAQIEQSTQLALLRMGEDAADVTLEMQSRVAQDMREKAASGELFGAKEIEAALRGYLASGAKAIDKTAEELAELAAKERAAATDTKKMTAAVQGLDNAYSGLNREISDTNDLQTAVDVIKAGDKASEDYAKALDYLADRYGVTTDQVEGNIDAYQRDADIKATLLELNIVLAQQEAITAQQTAANMVVMGTATEEEAAKMIAALDGVIAKLGELSGEEGLGGIGVSLPATWRAPKATKRASGGSRSGSSRNTALENELAAIDRKRKQNKITAEEEIALLWKAHNTLTRTADERAKVYDKIYAQRKEQEQRAYDMDVYYGRMTLEQQRERTRQMIKQYKAGTDARIELEKQLYDIQKQLRDRDTDNLSRLADGVITALQNRYGAQREQETEAIEASIQAWRDWANNQIEAINDQIRALDDLTRDEDRSDEERRRRRKIAALEQQRDYETDAYNRRKLDEQIAKEQADLEKWLTRIEREDMKEELSKQADEISKRADLEEQGLQEQLDALDKFYDERLKQHNLEAEAEQLMLTSSQQDIIKLIESFAPEYNAAGKTLGERLYEGFAEKATDIGAWFEAVNSQLEAYQRQAANTATAAAMAFWASHGTPTSQGTATDPGAPVTTIPPIVINMYDVPDSPAKFAAELERMLERLTRS